MKNGFTLIELMTVVGILAVLAVLSAPTYRAVQENIALKNTAYEIVNILRLAQNQSLVSQGGTNHGVYFSSGGYVLYAGDNYGTATEKTAYNLSYGLNIYSGAGSEVVFRRLTGATAPLTVTLGLDPADVRTIDIDKNGKVEVN